MQNSDSAYLFTFIDISGVTEGGLGGALPPQFTILAPHLWKMIYSTKRIVMTNRNIK